MDYPQIREYIDAISIPENFDKHTDLTLEKRGRLPVMSSGKFAVVFKMTDGERSYAVKCFIKERPDRPPGGVAAAVVPRHGRAGVNGPVGGVRLRGGPACEE